jgi:carbonic anhydrase
MEAQATGDRADMSSFPETLTDRFRRFRHRHFVPNADQYEELAAYGQSPEVMLISCCDSRVDPETIFSAMPGELFVVRNVANLVPPYETGGKFHGVSSAIEFAVLNLRVKHLVIMGHSGCGGVKAALDQSAAIQTEAQFISRWMSMLDEARLRVVSAHQMASQAVKLAALEREGIKTSIKNLRTFPFVSEAEDKGRLSLHGAYFDIATGTLSVLNHSRGEFFAL